MFQLTIKLKRRRASFGLDFPTFSWIGVGKEDKPVEADLKPRIVRIEIDKTNPQRESISASPKIAEAGQWYKEAQADQLGDEGQADWDDCSHSHPPRPQWRIHQQRQHHLQLNCHQLHQHAQWKKRTILTSRASTQDLWGDQDGDQGGIT